MAFLLSHRRPFVADHFHAEPYFVEARHGHNWMVEAAVEVEDEAAEPAFLQALDGWVEGLDYTVLNEQGRLAQRNPTTELLAQWVCEDLAAAGFRVAWVKVREKANYWALCRPA